MGRAGGLLVDGTAEEHLRIGALEDAGNAGAPLELLLDDRPDGLMSSLGILDLLLPELGEPESRLTVPCAPLSVKSSTSGAVTLNEPI